MSYFNLIPQELNDEVCFYLDYNESLILQDLFNIKINYQRLLSLKFPGFYKMIKELKEKDVKYINFTYEKSYSLINSVSVYLDNLRNEGGYLKYDKLASDKIEEVKIALFSNNIFLPEIKDILASHEMTVSSEILGIKYYKYKNREYYKYKNYFPDIVGIENTFINACDEFIYYKNNLQSLSKKIHINGTYCILLLYVLDTPEITAEIKKKILEDYNPNRKLKEFSLETVNTGRILWQYILKYLK
jgi:hypothetical protein